MNRETFHILLKARGLKIPQVATALKVSRQSVYDWLNLKKGRSIGGNHLFGLAKLLQIPVEVLMNPLPCIGGVEGKKLEASLNWDHLYPSVLDLLLAVKQWRPKALARLVQTYGLFTSSRIVGNKKGIFDRYPHYKQYIHPSIGQVLDQIWELECKHKSS